MSLTVQIEGENGSRVGEPWWHARSTELLAADYPGTCCLQFIDPYGNTIFNQAQLPVLLEELQALRARLHDAELVSVIDALSAFVQRALDRVHIYVRFIGD